MKDLPQRRVATEIRDAWGLKRRMFLPIDGRRAAARFQFLRRYDPDQVRRVTALPWRAVGISVP
jgi:hypothetical protein